MAADKHPRFLYTKGNGGVFMKLGLVQTKHNAMYNFLNPDFPFDRGTCLALQAAQVEQNLTLLAEAARQGYDLLVTTECINYIRTSTHRQMPRCTHR